ncbi:MAG: zinc-ribbon domain-containing protein [Chloroflexi bacterium]|nr:zinc-ribbon domain-containing protein [Chloroflexota bacterium]
MPSNIICQRCQCINEPYATTCQRCGARFCPNCKLVIDSPNAKICPHCGKTDLSFKPGKYAGSTYVAPGVSGAPASQNYCSNCGSRVESGVKKCPYCGRLGTLVTQTPRQGYGVMKSAHGGPDQSYSPEPEITTQKVCQKCGRQIPPGSSLCPVHGKFGGGNTLKQGFGSRDTSVEAEAYRRMATRGTEAAEHTRPTTHRAPPEDTYPQMVSGPPALPREAIPQPDMQELRTCPNCGSSVPDRSKVCPNCGHNRLPPQRSRPIFKAEAFYKTREASAQAYPAYMPPAEQYYGQPAVQPYEESYPAATPGFIEEIKPEKKRKKEKQPKEAAYKDASRGQKKSPWPMLLALLALAGVIIIAVVLIMDMLKTPTPITTLPSNTNPGTVVAKPPVISNIQYTDIGKTGATVTWTTDKKSNSIVISCKEGGTLCENAKDDALVTSHSIKLTNLEQGQAYHITVKSMVNDVDASLDAPYVLRTTDVQDTTPPKITGVKVTNMSSTGTGTSVTVTWTTDEPATSQVSYGTSGSYGTLQPEQSDTTMLKSHDVTLYGLSPQTTFHFKVTSRDADGNEASSSDATFVTPAPAGSGIGNNAPDFTLDCADGSKVTLSSFRGSKVIINFWHTSCAPCMGEMPLLQQMHEANPNLPMLVIHGTALGPINLNYVGSLLQEKGFTFTVPLDITGQVSGLYSVSSVPQTFFLDASGTIRKIQDGSFSGLSQIENMLSSY